MKLTVHVSLFLSTTIELELTDGAEHVNAIRVTPMVQCPSFVFLSQGALAPGIKEECSLYALDAILRDHLEAVSDRIQSYGGAMVPEQMAPDGGAKA